MLQPLPSAAANPAAPIEAVDQLLRWVLPDETLSTFVARQNREATRTGVALIDTHTTLRPGPVLEIAGPSGTAKTELLIQIAAQALCRTEDLHAESQEQGHVVVVDCDGKFDMLRLIQVSGSILPQQQQQQQQTTAAGVQQHQSLLHDWALPRFHLVRCSSSLELLLALATLPQQLLEMQGRCRLLLLDNVAAYVLQDRAAGAAAAAAATAAARATAAGVGSPRGGCGMLSPTWQQQHPLGPQGQQPTAASSRTYAAATTAHASSTGSAVDVTRLHSAIAALLRALSHKLRCPVIVSKSARVSRQERDGRPILTQQEPMTVSWEALITHRLLLCPVTVPGHALAALSSSGPTPTEVAAQWQSGGYCGPLQHWTVGAPLA